LYISKNIAVTALYGFCFRALGTVHDQAAQRTNQLLFGLRADIATGYLLLRFLMLKYELLVLIEADEVEVDVLDAVLFQQVVRQQMAQV